MNLRLRFLPNRFTHFIESFEVRVSLEGVSRGEWIEETLRSVFQPTILEVINESHNHSVKPGSETHFKVVVVSESFSGKTRVARHRLVYQALGEPLSNGLHALAVTARTPEEWSADPVALVSPVCATRAKPKDSSP